MVFQCMLSTYLIPTVHRDTRLPSWRTQSLCSQQPPRLNEEFEKFRFVYFDRTGWTQTNDDIRICFFSKMCQWSMINFWTKSFWKNWQLHWNLFATSLSYIGPPACLPSMPKFKIFASKQTFNGKGFKCTWLCSYLGTALGRGLVFNADTAI